jgi:hypothetical protein
MLSGIERKTLEGIFDILDDALGDTDPNIPGNIPDDMDDSGIRVRISLLWACRKIREVLDNGN